MHEILRRSPPGAWVLDLGSAAGSFASERYAAVVVRADRKAPPRGTRGTFVVCDAAALPFRGSVFEAVVSNHSFEHFPLLAEALAEVRRTLRAGGSLYVAVPDSTTFTDRVCRWLVKEDGHVNQFGSLAGLISMVEQATGARHAATRVLCTSFSFLNRRNARSAAPRRLWLFANGSERFLRTLAYALRLLDRWAGTRTCVYGWACYFGPPIEIAREPWTNVCVRCGAGHPSDWLRAKGLVRRVRLILQAFDCPDCGAENYFTDDSHYVKLT